MYNRGHYNRGRYNRVSSDEAFFRPLPAALRTTASQPLLGQVVYPNPVAAGITCGGRGELLVEVTFYAETAGLVLNGSAVLAQDVYMTAGVSTLLCSLSSPSLKLYTSQDIDLGGLVLHPGETLVIDTGTITVTVDGVNAMEFWETGSTPFSLSHGDNIITYMDDSQSRDASMTVVWSDRWL